MAELGIGQNRQQRRPTSSANVQTAKEAERWRSDILREISRKIAKIQDSTLSEFQVRDLNDKINKLMRDKRHWEYKIKELGGPDYRRSAPRMMGDDGKEIPGSHGYRYFGRARDLPGVKELFQAPVPDSSALKSRGEMYKAVDADYYGYRDEDDGKLVAYEIGLAREELLRAMNEDKAAGLVPSTTLAGEDAVMANDGEGVDMPHDDDAVWNREYKYVEVIVPSGAEVEQWLVQKRKKELMEKFLTS